jgi:hypothetical protein
MNLQAAAECVAVLACARWIAIDGNYETYVFEGRLNRKIRKLLSEWRPWQYVAFVAPNTPKAVVLPGSTHARTAGITWLKRTYSRSSKGWV